MPSGNGDGDGVCDSVRAARLQTAGWRRAHGRAGVAALQTLLLPVTARLLLGRYGPGARLLGLCLFF